MGFTAVVHYQRGPSTRIDFRDYDRALKFATDRARSPFVERVEIVSDHRMVWSDVKGVIAES